MHIERLEQQMRLVPHPLPQTLKFRPIEIILQDGLVIRMRALVDNLPRTLARRHAPDIRQPLSK